MTESTGPEPDKFDALDCIAAWIAATAPGGTVVAEDRVGPSAVFDAEEKATIARTVARRRDDDMSAARPRGARTARCIAAGLLPDSDRVPQWPEALRGRSAMLAGCASRSSGARDLVGIGIDIEEPTNSRRR